MKGWQFQFVSKKIGTYEIIGKEIVECFTHPYMSVHYNVCYRDCFDDIRYPVVWILKG